MLNIKKIPYAIRYIGYGDVAAHHRMTPNKKSLPVLEYQAGKYMTESMSIVQYIDKLHGTPMLYSYQPHSQSTSDLFNPEHMFQGPVGKLVLPRLIRIKLPELTTPVDRDYYVSKKTNVVGNLDDNYQRSKQLMDEVSDKVMSISDQWFRSRVDAVASSGIIYDDLVVWPMIRLCTVVKGFPWTPRAKQYRDTIQQLVAIPMFDEQAI